jgi:aspartyl-tRNA synthetase
MLWQLIYFDIHNIYIQELNLNNMQSVFKGWVESVRDVGNIKFFMIRSRSGLTQITAKKSDVPEEVFKMISDLSKEDCVEVHGHLVESKIAKIGKELIPERIVVLAKAEKPLPLDIQVGGEKDTRLDYRFMDLRDPKVQRIFIIKHKIMGLAHEYFRNNGFTEVQTPVIQAAGAEGGSSLFEIKYYGKKAFLRQSPQLYKQILMASGLDKVYEIGQAFRAEKFHTHRHVCEFISLDYELAWIDSEEDVMKVLENLMVHVLKGIKSSLEVKIPELPFKRMTYDEVLKILGKEGNELKWGDDLSDLQEKKLGEILAKKGIEWYFITKYPSKLKPFYIMYYGDYSRGIDLDYKGMEMASGGQREHRHDELSKVMSEKGLDLKNFKFYLDAFKYGMPPHGGIGFGVERLIEQLLGTGDIKETILFPRTPERFLP